MTIAGVDVLSQKNMVHEVPISLCEMLHNQTDGMN